MSFRNALPAVGILALGIVIGKLVHFFIGRFQDFTPKSLASGPTTLCRPHQGCSFSDHSYSLRNNPSLYFTIVNHLAFEILIDKGHLRKHKS